MLELAYLIAPRTQMTSSRNILRNYVAITAFIFGTRLF